ncbi:hypothetical protein SISSUDRAFT_1014930 [Sistotremastrum suecicum HHB10207 ss-3]|uniref:Uncharacterized protein n=1 Tax=Sistotremastrum suecicum HHB10207 ss-3 TaxID=1314776 RepID=A0A166HP32_9AGAM|nr:hypothetical protein SISSUDRAFT_1014930 [Sistotremastrum suecicum HHB10207 ss-3]
MRTFIALLSSFGLYVTVSSQNLHEDVVLKRNTEASHLHKRGHSDFTVHHNAPRAPAAACEPADPANTVTTRLNNLLATSGPGYVLNLCPSQQYLIQQPISFAAPNQEITTFGNPTDDTRATLVVSGSRATDGSGHSTAVNGQCATCNGCKLHHIQINGTRNGVLPLTGGANIEMGGPTTGQVIEFVRSFDPRSWSCMHAAEGQLNCSNMTIQNNDVGPCGSDLFNQWADGISVACPKSIVRNNMINTPTDGGIVLFGAPGTIVENNTIWVETNTLLGAINMVDYTPWGGDYTGTIVQNNTIIGGFATSEEIPGDSKGINNQDAMIKVGIAMGPRVWFGDRVLHNISFNGIVRNNQFTGGFGFAMAANGVRNFTVEGNTLVGNTSFFGAVGPNCTKTETIDPEAFVYVLANATGSEFQSEFASVQDGDGLICIQPPEGDFWPIAGNANPKFGQPSSTMPQSGGSDTSRTVGLAVGIPLGIALVVILTFLIRRRAVQTLPDASRAGGSEKGWTRRTSL